MWIHIFLYDRDIVGFTTSSYIITMLWHPAHPAHSRRQRSSSQSTALHRFHHPSDDPARQGRTACLYLHTCSLLESEGAQRGFRSQVCWPLHGICLASQIGSAVQYRRDRWNVIRWGWYRLSFVGKRGDDSVDRVQDGLRTGTESLRNMLIPFLTSDKATSWGVETITAPTVRSIPCMKSSQLNINTHHPHTPIDLM